MFYPERSRRTAQKGNILVPILAGALLIAIASAAYFFWQNQQLQQQSTTLYSNINNSYPSPIPTSTTTPNETTNWKAYSNSKFNYQFKYPADWYIEEDSTGRLVTLDNKPINRPQGIDGAGNVYIEFETQGKNKIDVQITDPVGTKKEIAKGTFVEKVEDLVIGGRKAAKMRIYHNFTSDSATWIEIDLGTDYLRAASHSKDRYSLLDQILSTFQFAK